MQDLIEESADEFLDLLKSEDCLFYFWCAGGCAGGCLGSGDAGMRWVLHCAG